MEKLSWRHKIIVAALLLLFFIRLLLIIGEKSAGFDEVIYPAAGYAIFHQFNYNINKENPPLAKLITALPLLFYRLKLPEVQQYPADHPFYHFAYGNEFLQENNLSAQKILFLSRLPIVAVALLLGFLVFFVTSRLFGITAGIVALSGYTLCPNILAYSGLATTDLLMAFWWLVFVSWSLIFIGELKLPLSRFRLLLIGGLIWGLALSTKFSAWLFGIYLLLLLVSEHYRQGLSLEKLFSWLSIILLIASGVILLIYCFKNLGAFFEGIAGILPMVTSGTGAGMTYLLGRVSPVGWRYYYLFVFLLKMPPSVIALVIWSAVIIWRQRLLRFSPAVFYLLLAILVIFVSLSLSAYQTGTRFFLPVIPLLWIILGMTASQILEKNRRHPLLIILLVAYIFSSLLAHPFYLSYISELFGGSRYGYRYLADSNIDWGTELPALKKYLQKNNNPKILLSYYGNNDPHYYGIEFAELAERSRIKGKATFYDRWDDILLIVSANNLTSAYYPPTFDFFRWLWEKKPLAIVGNTFYVYKLADDVYSLKKIAELYIAQNRLAEAIVAYRRILELEENEENLMRLAELYYNLGDKKEARFYLEKILALNPQNILANERLKTLK